MTEFFNKLNLKSEYISSSLFITLLGLLQLYGNTGFELSELSKLYLSEATLNGVDIGKRIKLFYGVIFSFIILFFLCYKLHEFLKKHFHFNSNQWNTLKVICGIGSVLILTHVFGVQNEALIGLIAFFTAWFYVVFVLQRKQLVPRILGQPLLHLRLLVLTIILSGSILFINNSTPFFVNSGAISFSVLFLLLVASFTLVYKYVKLSPNRIFSFCYPLALVPIFLFLSIEMQFLLKQKAGEFIPYKWLFIGLSAFSLLAWALYVLVSKKRFFAPRAFQQFIVPAALLTFILLVEYMPIISQPTELFELANPAIAQLRIFRFNEIPFLDFVSSHMFSEQWYGIIYHSLFGFTGTMEFMVYQFFDSIIYYFIIYFLLLNLFRSAINSLIFILTFPFLPELFHIYLITGVLAYFLIQKAVQTQSGKNYFFVFMGLSFLCFWRLDTGVASVFSSLVFFPITYYSQNIRPKLSAIVNGMASFSFLVALILCVLISITNADYVFGNIATALHYFGGSQAHGLSWLTDNYNQQYFVHHIVFPLIAVIIIIISALQARISTSPINRYLLSAGIFLLLIYLFNFQRGLVRHGFMEKQDFHLLSTLFLGLSFFLVAQLKKVKRKMAFLPLFTIGFFGILAFKYYPIDKNKNNFNKFLTQPTIAGLDHQFNDSFEGRVQNSQSFALDTYLDLKQFMDENLSPNQTFFDFSNTPMLYYYCERQVPSYFCQNLQNTVDEYLQVEQLKLLSTELTPIIIYSNYPETWWDATDGVPNAIRQNLIAEFIHKNYQPHSIINNKNIWIAKGLTISSLMLDSSIIAKPKTYKYREAARYLAHFFESDSNGRYMSIPKAFSLTKDTFKHQYYSVNQSIKKLERVLIKVEFAESKGKQTFEIDLFEDSMKLGTTSFETKRNHLNYLVPISNHFVWFNANVTHLRVSKSSDIQIHSFSGYKDLRSEY